MTIILIGILSILLILGLMIKDQFYKISMTAAAIFIFFVSLATFLISTELAKGRFDAFYYEYFLFDYSISVGIDALSFWMIILTTFLIPICILISWDSIKDKKFIMNLLIIELLLIVVFTTLDILVFFVFFEGILIPMFYIIIIWGSRARKIYAAIQFFLFTLAGSISMLVAIMTIYMKTGTTSLPLILTSSFPLEMQLFLWIAFFIAFAVKVPMVPVHVWLPEAHVEAPTAGSVLLAGVLLKLGTYGFLRFSIPLFPEASIFFTPIIYLLSVIAIVYTSLTTLRQIDLKKIIAYASIGHMGFVTLGIFSLNIQAIEGSILVMLSHGIVSSALFIGIGLLYDRHKTRILKYYRGIASTMPVFSLIFFLFTLANISVPGTSSFVGEFLILVGSFQSSPIITFFASFGIILGAAYSIWLYNRVFFGNLSLYLSHYNDLNYREFMIFIPLCLLTLYMGIYPDVFLGALHPCVTSLINYA